MYKFCNKNFIIAKNNLIVHKNYELAKEMILDIHLQSIFGVVSKKRQQKRKKSTRL